MAKAHQSTETAASKLTADVYETAGGDAYVIEIPVPGLKPDEILIEVTSSTVTVSTQPHQSEANGDRRYLQREQPAGPMARVFEFPMEIDTDNVQATLKDGMLKIEVRKAAAARRRIIQIGQVSRTGDQNSNVTGQQPDGRDQQEVRRQRTA
jgi:HSP20 family molecular chaperone IbpA